MVACLEADSGIPADDVMQFQSQLHFLADAFGHDLFIESVVPGANKPDLQGNGVATFPFGFAGSFFPDKSGNGVAIFSIWRYLSTAFRNSGEE